jgi:SIR2-like domain
MDFEGEGQELRPVLFGGEAGAEAFILGAGFSHAISAAMPLVKDLVAPLDEFLARSRGASVATFPHLENVEAFLSALAMPQPFLDDAANSYNSGLFIEVTLWLARWMLLAQQHTLGSELPGWLEGLVRSWHARRSTVITLNYDTLVESAVFSMDLHSPSAGRVMPQFTYANPVRFAASEWAGTYNQYAGRMPTFTLCKLHGSLSWWRSGAAQQPPLDVEVWKDAFNSSERAGWADIASRVMLGQPMLVPPVLAKTDYFDNELIRTNWRRAFHGLAQATTIVVMGYSFPSGDSQMAALLGSAIRENEGQQIVVVDPDRDVVDRVAEVGLPRTGLVRHFGESEQPIASWSERWAQNPNAEYAN